MEGGFNRRPTAARLKGYQEESDEQVSPYQVVLAMRLRCSPCQTFYSTRKLKAVARKWNLASTFLRLRIRKRLVPCYSVRIPKTGSINPSRQEYRAFAPSVVIHRRCLRSKASVGPIYKAPPESAHLRYIPHKSGKHGIVLEAWKIR